jgi:hypothetical protein
MGKIPLKRQFLVVLLGAMCVSLAGCYPDQFENPAQWSMNGSERENTALMTADKSELIQGHGTPAASNGVAAAAAVDVAIGGTAGNASGLQKPPPAITFSSSGTGN